MDVYVPESSGAVKLSNGFPKRPGEVTGPSSQGAQLKDLLHEALAGPCLALAGGWGRRGREGRGPCPWGVGGGVPWPGSVIPDFTLPDTLEKNFVRDLASNFSK